MAGMGHLKMVCKDAFSVAGAVQKTCIMYRQINVGCSREGLHTSIGNPFFVFCCPCCIRCWVVSVDCRKGTGDHVSWKHMRCYKGRLFESPDDVSAAVIHCTRSRCSIRNSLHAEEGSTPKSCNLQIPLTLNPLILSCP